MKKCRRCKITKSHTEFNKTRITEDGYSSACSACKSRTTSSLYNDLEHNPLQCWACGCGTNLTPDRAKYICSKCYIDRGRRSVLNYSGVYFILALGHVKIGYGSTIGARLVQLQVGCPEQLIIIGFQVGDDLREMEKMLHEQYEHLRRRGEWFECTAELLLDIDNKYNGEQCRRLFKNS